MSAVTAIAAIGETHPYCGGVEPQWLALLHEGARLAWQVVPVDAQGPDGPGSAGRVRSVTCPTGTCPLDWLRVAVHLWCAAPCSDVRRLLRGELAYHGVRTSTRFEAPPAAVSKVLDLARIGPGPDPALALTVLAGSVLTGHAGDLHALPGWHGEWAESAGGQSFSVFAAAWQAWER